MARPQYKDFFRKFIPISLGRRALWLIRSLVALPGDALLLRAERPRGQPRTYYGFNEIPRSNASSKIIHGGMIKVQRLQKNFPNSPTQFNIVYMVSSAMPNGAIQKAWIARKKGVYLVWNQNGTAYPGWPDKGWKAVNAPMANLHKIADYVFYQSQFCKESAEEFLGKRDGPSEILFNAVDTSIFTPSETDPDPENLILLLGGNQYAFYRLECALKILAILLRDKVEAILLVTGKLCWTPNQRAAESQASNLIKELHLENKVRFIKPYTQDEAPNIFRQAHILLHTKYNDPSPGLIVEAMASGLPIVYSKSGGVPELVGEDAGIGVSVETTWERDILPDAESMAQAVLLVASRRQEFGCAARNRAVTHFDIRPWIDRHREVFEALLR